MLVAGALFLLGTFAPALVALGLTERAGGRAAVRTLLGRIIDGRVGARWYVFAAGYIPAVELSVALVHRLSTGAWPGFGDTAWYLMAVAIMFSTWVQAGEEIGWRGYALPRLSERFGLALASIILGIIWATWHLPLFFVPHSDIFGQSFPLYVLQVTALSVAMAWLYWRTRASLLPVMVLHAAVNNTRDIVPSAVPGATNAFALSTSLVAWITVALLWLGAAYFLIQMRRVGAGPRNDITRGAHRGVTRVARTQDRSIYFASTLPETDHMRLPATVASVLIALVVTSSAVNAQQARGVRVFISVDMEGLAGVVAASEVTPAGPDYAHFRAIMAAETNAAVDGAFRAGATDVLVRDSHGSKQNLLPGDVDPRARLLRGASAGPRNMMEGIDSTFDAVVFIGYHAKAGTANAILEHTSTGNVVDVSINGVSLPEGGYNALVAGLYGVPVVFVAGDRAVVEQLRGLLGPIGAVAVKEEIGDASLGLSPKQAQDEIRNGVEQAVRKRAEAKPYRLTGPYTMVLKVRQERPLHPGAERVREGEFRFSSPDLLQVLTAFNAMK